MSTISDFSDLPKFFLADFSKDDQIWDTQRSYAQGVQELYKTSSFETFKMASLTFYKYSERIEKCSNILKFGFTEDNKMKLKQAFFCRVRYCPVCQWRRSMMWRARFFQIMPKLSEQYPTHRWIFLTLTLKNPPMDELRLTLKHMSKSWNKFIKYKKLSAIAGWVRTTEITYGKDGKPHPHFHCLLLVKPSYFGKGYVKVRSDDEKEETFQSLWKKALEVDYNPVLKVQKVKKHYEDITNANEVDDADTIGAVLETLKYSTKPSDFFKDKNWFLKLTQQTHKMHFIASGGVLKHCLKPEDEITNDDLIHVNEDEESDDPTDERRIAFFYNDDLRRYHRANKYDENMGE